VNQLKAENRLRGIQIQKLVSLLQSSTLCAAKSRGAGMRKDEVCLHFTYFKVFQGPVIFNELEPIWYSSNVNVNNSRYMKYSINAALY
jgi:hypothetical protein